MCTVLNILNKKEANKEGLEEREDVEENMALARLSKGKLEEMELTQGNYLDLFQVIMKEEVRQFRPQEGCEEVERIQPSTRPIIKKDETASGKEVNTMFETISAKCMVGCDMAK